MASMRPIYGANVVRNGLGDRRPKMVEWRQMGVLQGDELRT